MHKFEKVEDINNFDLTKEYYYEQEDFDTGKLPIDVKVNTLGHLTSLVVNGNLYEKVELPWYENIPSTGLLVKKRDEEVVVMAKVHNAHMYFECSMGYDHYTEDYTPLTKHEIQVYLNDAPE